MSDKLSKALRKEKLRETERILGPELTNRLNEAEDKGIMEGASIVGTMCALGGYPLFVGASGGNFGFKESIFYVGAIITGTLLGAARGRYFNIVDEVNRIIKEFPEGREDILDWFYYK